YEVAFESTLHLQSIIEQKCICEQNKDFTYLTKVIESRFCLKKYLDKYSFDLRSVHISVILRRGYYRLIAEHKCSESEKKFANSLA
ncbi:hypothetical protein ACJX0J_017593, partial [Zea mays]